MRETILKKYTGMTHEQAMQDDFQVPNHVKLDSDNKKTFPKSDADIKRDSIENNRQNKFPSSKEEWKGIMSLGEIAESEGKDEVVFENYNKLYTKIADQEQEIERLTAENEGNKTIAIERGKGIEELQAEIERLKRKDNEQRPVT
jgi:uncharacterized small protein (DUF1192 family)